MSEHQPLLPLRPSTTSHSSLANPKNPWTLPFFPTFTTISPRYRFIPLVGCTLIFLNEAEYFIKQVATLRAIESMYCYDFHHASQNWDLVRLGKHIPERLCKDAPIQKDLAQMAGLIMFVRMVAAMVGAVPLGYVADRWGRRVVVVLHKVNVVVSCGVWMGLYLLFPKVPIWTLCFSGLSGLIGGNFDIGLAMLFASYTDVMPSATERASLFFLTTSMQFLAQTFCPFIGAWLMNLDGKGGTPEVNLAVSLVLATLTMLLAIFAFPETLHESRKASDVSHEDTARATMQRTTPAEEEEEEEESEITANTTKQTTTVLTLSTTLLLSLCIATAATGIKSIDWYAIIQYPIIKLHFTFPQASTIVSLQGILMLLHFSLLLPFLNRTAAAWLGSPAHAHFSIMAGSCFLLTLGALVMGLSTTAAAFVTGVVIYLFGEGLPTATQAFIVSLVEKQQVARVMATLSMTSIFGKLMASLLFPKVLALGLDSHIDVLVGLPFFVCAGLFVVSAVCFSVVGLGCGVDKVRW